MSKSNEPYEAEVDLNKLMSRNITLDADQIDQIVEEIRTMLNDEVTKVLHRAPMRDSIGYGVLTVIGEGRSERGFQQRVNAAATTVLRQVIEGRAS